VIPATTGPLAPPLLHEDRHDDQNPRHQQRDERQKVKKFPYHNEDNVTLPGLQSNGCLAVGGLQARWNASTVAFQIREGGPVRKGLAHTVGAGFLLLGGLSDVD